MFQTPQEENTTWTKHVTTAAAYNDKIENLQLVEAVCLDGVNKLSLNEGVNDGLLKTR